MVNRALNVFLEPRNPFEPKEARKPKMETVIFGMLFGLVVAAFLFFNLAAPRPAGVPMSNAWKACLDGALRGGEVAGLYFTTRTAYRR